MTEKLLIRIGVLSAICMTLIASCGTRNAGEEYTLQEILDRLKEHTAPMVFGEDSGAAMIVAPSLGARVLALSDRGVSGNNLFWLNAKIFEENFWKDGPEWNAGGLRSWLAPEKELFMDRQGAWFVPEAVDPGSYRLVNSTGTMAVFSNEIKVKNRDGIEYRCTLTREIHLLGEYQWPELATIPDGVRYAGVRIVHSLENLGEDTIGESIPHIGLWSILQVSAPGTMIIPIANPGWEGEAYRSYSDPIPPERLSVSDDVLTINADGRMKYKIGIAPEYSTAALAYISMDGHGGGRLFIKQFMVDPNGLYVDSPWEEESDFGDAVQVYNDDGTTGGFAEMECHGPVQKMKPGDKQSHDVRVHVFTGPAESLKAILSRLLHVDSSQLNYYN